MSHTPDDKSLPTVAEFLDHVSSLIEPTLPQPQPAVLEAKLTPGQVQATWLLMATSRIRAGDEPEAVQHSGIEATYRVEESDRCPACGELHDTLLFSFFGKTRQEVERMRAAIHREMRAILEDRGERLAS